MITSASRSTPSAASDRTSVPTRSIRAGDQLDVVAAQGRVPVAGEQHPLAADLVVGGRLREQLRVVAELPVSLPVGDLAERGQHRVVSGEPVGADLEEGEQAEATGGDAEREAAEQASLPLRVGRGPSSAGSTAPSAGRSWSTRRPRAISGTNWIALAPVPTTATRRPVRSRSWSHSAEWNTGPVEVVDAGAAAGSTGRVSWPQAVTRTSNCGSSPASVRTVQRPALGVEAGLGDLGASRRCGSIPKSRAHVLEVGEDLRLRRVTARPVVARGERERVQVRGDVAGGARVGVRAPDPADRVAALEHGQLLEPGLAQPDRRADAAEPGADDPGG